jgi:ssDNA-specific exonuclease RecJ
MLQDATFNQTMWNLYLAVAQLASWCVREMSRNTACKRYFTDFPASSNTAVNRIYQEHYKQLFFFFEATVRSQFIMIFTTCAVVGWSQQQQQQQ